jgi:sterol desaturase/sphingolipid hydroxylase (fatty acid hydroxylase superfamily)
MEDYCVPWITSNDLNGMPDDGPERGFCRLYKYKIQKDEPVTREQVFKCIKRILVNQFLFHVLPLLLLYKYGGRKLPRRMLNRHPPGWKRLIAEAIFFLFCSEITFYLTHRFVHLPWMYKRVHKIHHEFRAPIAIAAEYAHPVEMVLSNILPNVVGPALVRAHVVSNWIYIVWGIVLTCTHHSGYAFPWLPGFTSPRMHDYHHYSFNSNYGVVGLLDYVLGTDQGFREYSRKLKEQEANELAAEQGEQAEEGDQCEKEASQLNRS